MSNDPFAPISQAGSAILETAPTAPDIIQLTPAATAPNAGAFRHSRFGEPSRIWIYRDVAGNPVGAVARYENAPGKKIILPFAHGRRQWKDQAGNELDKTGWHPKAMPEPRPLYGIAELMRRPDAEVLVVEGEKTADAAAKLFSDMVVLTSVGGAMAAKKADWGPLAGRRVTIWPDHDEAGFGYASAVADLARAAGAASVAIVPVPEGWPEGWDLADPPPNDAVPGTLAKLLHAAVIQQVHVVQVEPGTLDAAIDAAEHSLAGAGRHFLAGGIVATVAWTVGGDARVVPCTAASLTRDLAATAKWVRKRNGQWLPCDPPERHVAVVLDGQTLRHLRQLDGVARQPFFQPDGSLVRSAGYNAQSRLFCSFDPTDFPEVGTTKEAAREALEQLHGLLAGFHFATPFDRSAAIAAILTAATRVSLPHAPAFSVTAPVYGSGKSFLCSILAAFATSGESHRVSYPATAEEATKTVLALLIGAPAVIEFDDMQNDWTPHGAINRLLTAASMTDRILGVSKTATVSTRVLVLGSGNNVSPVRDLLRRIVTIHLDPHVEIPATLTYASDPLAAVRADRGRFVMAALTIVAAWHAAGSPRADVAPIATYSGLWSDYCRHTLLWLGEPDPVTRLLEQMAADTDAEAVGFLLQEWFRVFGSTPITVRRLVDATCVGNAALLEALQQLPVEDKGAINRGRLGWFLKRICDRIVSGLVLRAARADGRSAWRVEVAPRKAAVDDAGGAGWSAVL